MKTRNNIFYLISTISILSLLHCPVATQSTIDYKICSTPGNLDACSQIARDNKLACKNYRHKVDCMIDMDIGRSHVGLISPEEAFLGATQLSDNVKVIAEIVGMFSPAETVVIVRSNSAINSLNDLKGKKLCHPGYKHDEAFSALMLQELEIEVLKNKNLDCSTNSTLLEKQISILADFFGESCRPGPWTENDIFDNTLKSKYASLCNLCGSDKCNVNYDAPFNNSLQCLTKNNADIAVTTLREAESFLNASEIKQNYKYLCKNGTVTDLPCPWSKQLRKLIIAQSGVASSISSYLKDKLKTKTTNINAQGLSTDFLEKYFTTILDIKRFETVKFLDTPYKSLRQYVKERRNPPTAKDNIKCDTTLKWCTYSDLEYQKCTWLSQAALNRAIQPVVECYRSEFNDELSCLDDVKMDKADIVVASSDYAYISLKKDLVGLAYPETDTRNLSTILIVKKSNDTSINSLKDLMSKRACLPRYGGGEFLAFVDTMKSLKVANEKVSDCNYGKSFSDFVGNSCIPGVLYTSIQEATEEVDKDKLCSTCVPVNASTTAIYCNADDNNKYFGNDGAVRCLSEGSGDFAVITKSQISGNITAENLKVICKNGELSNQNGLEVDDDCTLTTITSSEIVAKSDNRNNPDIILALHEFESWFGKDLHKPFHIFDVFNRTLDLLFKDSTPGLDFDYKNKYINNYRQMLDHAKTCSISDPNNSEMTKASIFIVLPVLIVSYLFSF